MQLKKTFPKEILEFYRCKKTDLIKILKLLFFTATIFLFVHYVIMIGTGDIIVSIKIPLRNNLKLTSEKQLVERAQVDSDAFGRIFDLYYNDIYNYILHRTANVSLSQDLCSDTFFIALRKIKNFKWRNVSISAWLYRIASNEINLYFRKNKKNKKVSIENINELKSEESAEIIDEIIKAEDIIKKEKIFLNLHKYTAELKDKYSEVIILRFFEKKKIREIAEILNKSEGTIKSLLHRALKQLQTKINTREFKEV